MDDKQFRRTLGSFASGVTIVTGVDQEKRKVGLTVSAFSSLSLNPPLILVCIDKRSDSLSAFAKGRPFAINILSEEQSDTAMIFAKKGIDKFENVTISITEQNVPVLNQNLATLHCEVHNVVEGGDHDIIIGLVKESEIHERKPLLYYNGQLGNLKVESTVG
ncbi:flavin reductase family protein [Brevibacillus daliensis]|uniref:flavin reductase family protein n=1 Tax=Brevibacillus daliensis TaxID=2892995 RepID=UPI001E2F817C|nr:flavin reductase family protein [Brevibacillus daliensis]